MTNLCKHDNELQDLLIELWMFNRRGTLVAHLTELKVFLVFVIILLPFNVLLQLLNQLLLVSDLNMVIQNRSCSNEGIYWRLCAE